MIPKFHPAVFLGAVILVCAAWLWVRPPVSAIETVARGRPRPALVVPKSIELDQALLERYVGRYEGRGGFAIDLTLKRGTLFAQGTEIEAMQRMHERITAGQRGAPHPR